MQYVHDEESLAAGLDRKYLTWKKSIIIIIIFFFWGGVHFVAYFYCISLCWLTKFDLEHLKIMDFCQPCMVGYPVNPNSCEENGCSY